MKRVEKKIAAATREATESNAPTAPLMVPHGGAEAGRDFECAFEVLPRDERVRELWRRASGKRRFVRAP